MKAKLRNELLLALASGAEVYAQPGWDPRKPPDHVAEELKRHADLLCSLGDALDQDPAGIVQLVTEALERVVAAMRARQPSDDGGR